ncbi:MAG: hypothetical protein ACE5IF_03325 [Candidatus Bathyarchaeia archaeon]
METDWIRIAGLTVTVLAVLVFSILIISYELPTFNLVEPVIMETSEFLWTYRLIDMIAQAFVLFAAAACCVAVLRAEEEE